MRREARELNAVQVERIQDYHDRMWSTEAYAWSGFKSNKYFASDRPERLTSNMERTGTHAGQPLRGVGLEVETESWGVLNEYALAELMSKVIFPLFPDDLFKMQHDGSLGGGDCIGVECITQVMTKAFIRNLYRYFKTMFDVYFPAFKISSAQSGNCGMHVNLSNALFGDTVDEQAEAIRKLHYIVNRNFTMACRLVGRNPERTSYCGQMSYSNARHMSIGGGDHYVCLNYSHFTSGRIELRLVGGQKNFAAFRNTMESVFFLVERVRKLRWEDIDDMRKVFRGCNQYVYSRLQLCGLSDEVLADIRQHVKHEELI